MLMSLVRCLDRLELMYQPQKLESEKERLLHTLIRTRRKLAKEKYAHHVFHDKLIEVRLTVAATPACIMATVS